MSIRWRVSEREDPQKCHFLYFSERSLQQFCTMVQTVIQCCCPRCWSWSRGASRTHFCGLGLGRGLGLAQWCCLHVIEVNSDAVTNRLTDAHRVLYPCVHRPTNKPWSHTNTMSVWRILCVKIARWIKRAPVAFSSQVILTALGMFVSFNEAKLVTIQLGLQDD